MDEHYRPMQGFPGYRARREGVVESRCRAGFRNKRTEGWHPLKPITVRGGYLAVNLYRDGGRFRLLIHQLVPQAFGGLHPPGETAATSTAIRRTTGSTTWPAAPTRRT